MCVEFLESYYPLVQLPLNLKLYCSNNALVDIVFFCSDSSSCIIMNPEGDDGLFVNSFYMLLTV